MFPTANPTSADEVHPDDPFLTKIVMSRDSLGVATAWAWAASVQSSSATDTTDPVSEARLSEIETSVSDINGKTYSPAGQNNTSFWVYEDIAGVRVEAFAITGSENLASLLSDAGAQNHWHAVWHGEHIQWKAEYSHLFREGMLIIVDSDSGVGSKLFRVKAGATPAQLAINPTDPNVLPANSGYEPWSYE